MNEQNVNPQDNYQIYPIGFVRRDDNSVQLQIREAFRPALKQLNHFSHVNVFWWANECDNEALRNTLQTNPPYAEDKRTGVFACRSEYRPNPIAMTVCKILEVNEKAGTVRINNIDAVNNSPILDLKAYFPVTDRVKAAQIPDWLDGWPEWLPEEGIGLEY